MSNSLNIGEKIKYVFGALEIAKRNREGRELEIIKSANRMVEQLETELADKDKQLAEARAEIERLNKDHDDALDTIFAMLIAARGEDCTIEVLHAEMNAVSTKPSEYIKHVIAERDKLVEQMREALEAVVRVADRATVEFDMARAAIKAEKGEI